MVRCLRESAKEAGHGRRFEVVVVWVQGGGQGQKYESEIGQSGLQVGGWYVRVDDGCCGGFHRKLESNIEREREA